MPRRKPFSDPPCGTPRTTESRRDSFVYTPHYLRLCARTVETALEEVPAYRDWRRFDNRSADVLVRLAALPVLDKAAMRRHGPEGLLVQGQDHASALAAGHIELVHTSGSTGDRVQNIWFQPWWNESEKASWTLNAHARRARLGLHREAILTSPLCAGIPCDGAYLTMRQRTRGRFLYLNERVDPREWTPAHMARMIRELGAFHPSVLEANPSYLAWLCRFAAREGLEIPPPPIVILTYENPSRLHIEQIRSVLHAPIASSYGSTEAGYVFMECEHGRFHQNTVHCHVDFLPFAPLHGGPALGTILVTTLRNPWRSLLRFEIGDTVRLAAAPCPCGRRRGLTLAAIEGRHINLTTTPDGRAVTQLEVDRFMSRVPGIAQYELRQTSTSGYRITYAPLHAELPHTPIRLNIISVLRGVYGRRANFAVRRADSIPPDPPGKYRLTRRFTPVTIEHLLDPRFSPPVHYFPAMRSRGRQTRP